MNVERMRLRNLDIVDAVAATLPDCTLVFNKRSRFAADESRANIAFRSGARVEGVLYQLAAASEIVKLDPFEGTPRYYSREILPLHTESGMQSGWVYIANPAAIAQGLLPPRWYLQHLLAGREFLSEEYLASLHSVSCDENKQVEPW